MEIIFLNGENRNMYSYVTGVDSSSGTNALITGQTNKWPCVHSEVEHRSQSKLFSNCDLKLVLPEYILVLNLKNYAALINVSLMSSSVLDVVSF